jgi:host cell factor
LLFGGAGLSAQGVPEYYNDLRELDTETMIWSRARTSGDGPSARYMHIAAVVPGGQLVVYGGWGVGGLQCREENARQGAESIMVLDTVRSEWVRPKWAREAVVHKYGHTCCVGEGGAMVIFGGWDGKQALNDALVMQIVSPTTD